MDAKHLNIYVKDAQISQILYEEIGGFTGRKIVSSLFDPLVLGLLILPLIAIGYLFFSSEPQLFVEGDSQDLSSWFDDEAKEESPKI